MPGTARGTHKNSNKAPRINFSNDPFDIKAGSQDRVEQELSAIHYNDDTLDKKRLNLAIPLLGLSPSNTSGNSGRMMMLDGAN